MDINKDRINDCIDKAFGHLQEVFDKVPHDLNNEILLAARQTFHHVECDLVEAGVVIMFLQAREEFKMLLSDQITSGMANVFAGIFMDHLKDISEVKTYYESFMADFIAAK